MEKKYLEVSVPAQSSLLQRPESIHHYFVVYLSCTSKSHVGSSMSTYYLCYRCYLVSVCSCSGLGTWSLLGAALDHFGASFLCKQSLAAGSGAGPIVMFGPLGRYCLYLKP